MIGNVRRAPCQSVPTTKEFAMLRRSALLLAVFFLLPESVRSTDDPRALVEKALKALGGEEKLGQKVATQRKVRGTFWPAPGDALGLEVPIGGELRSQSGNRSRFSFHVEMLGNKVEAVQIMNGDKAWRVMNGQVSAIEGEELLGLKQSLHQDRVMSLIPLLKDKRFTLAALDETKVEGRPASGIKVSFPDQSDTEIYFDKETGLPVKYGYRAKRFGETKERLHETILGDYRELNPAAADERVLKSAGVAVDPAGLLEYLRMSGSDAGRVEKAKELIRKLGDDSFAVREKAAADLVELGAVALPFLREAAKDKDLEIARRAQECLDKIGERKGDSTRAAAIRLIAVRQPAGAAEVLLNSLPGADEALAREIRSALYAVALRDGKPDPILVKALEDKDPVRRAAAAAVLGKDGGAFLRQPRRRLVVSGVKMSFKTTSYTDGHKSMELFVEDVQLFNAFDDKDFAQP
jgi:hypothetical protein